MPARRHTLALAVLLAVVPLAACTEEAEPPADVVVTGEAGVAPTLEYPRPLEVSEPWSEVVWEGDGPELAAGEPVLLHYYAERADDGSLVGQTYDGEPKPVLLRPEALGADIHEALTGRRVGSRVLSVVPAGGRQDFPTVAVLDVLPTRATGEAVRRRAALPSVRLADDGTPHVTIPDTDPPTELEVQPLLKGTGPQVAPGQVITVQYTGVRWSDGKVFESTWSGSQLPAAFPIATNSVIAGWDAGLVEQTVGSQVLLVVPPSLAYGGAKHELAEETLVFVVDILAASGGPGGS